MQSIIVPAYFLFFLGLIVAGIFIVYHISKYSLSERNAWYGNMTFLVGLGILLLINAVSFFSIDWSSIQITPTAQRTQIW
jgi:hypothetical protein